MRRESVRADVVQAERGGARPATVVVGGGVSGSACAAVLASRGERVVLVSAALDGMCLPEYGPEVCAEGGFEELAGILGSMPAGLGEAWASAIMVVEGRDSLAVLDRRQLSIEVKRALEGIPGLELRQGIVCSVGVRTQGQPDRGGRGGDREAERHGDRAGVFVETVFGETIEADVAVIAVGLGLSEEGLVEPTCEDRSSGGRGETAGESLRTALERYGAKFAEAKEWVGARLQGPNLDVGGLGAGAIASIRAAAGGGGASPVKEGTLVELASRGIPAARWPVEYPPSVHRSEVRRPHKVWLGRCAGGGWSLEVSPDGAATGEVYVHPRGEEGEIGRGAREEEVPEGDGDGGEETTGGEPRLETRGAYRARGLRVVNLAVDGRVERAEAEESRLWVTGRAGGSRGYVGSIRAGIKAGEAVAAFLAQTRGPVGSGDQGSADLVGL